MDEKDARKKKIRMSILAGITSASVLMGSTFDSPRDILDEGSERPEPLREEYVHASDSFRSRKDSLIRRIIYLIPVRIRSILCIPLWFLGNGVILLLELLYRGILTPLRNIIAGFIIQNLILLGVIAVSIKILFPGLPWSKILNRKIVIIAFIGSLIMSILDFIMPKIWEGYRLYRMLSKLVIGLIVVVIVMRPFVKRRLRKIRTYEIEYEM